MGLHGARQGVPPHGDQVAAPVVDVPSVPLCVDLDGTLITTDVLFESLLQLIRSKPWYLALLPFWLLSGRAFLKRRIAEASPVDPATLPYNQELLDWLREEKRRGTNLVLTTAADERIARSVADYLGIFDEVLASNGMQNLKGEAKLHRLQERFPAFDYAGNSKADIAIWRKCRKAIVANASPAVLRRAASASAVDRIFTESGSVLRSLGLSLRPHQWLKNLLVFVPLVTSHQILVKTSLIPATIAFGAFCLCASAIYILNDLVDLPSDRIHPTKRERPFASGSIPIPVGLLLIPLLIAASFAIASTLRGHSMAILAIYLLLTTAYTFNLKRRLLLDVFSLASLYTLRIVIGQTSTGIAFSPWLLAFSMFMFLSLAFCKRSAELYQVCADRRGEAAGRAYRDSDLPLMTTFGVASAFASAVVLTLYFNSDIVKGLYRQPKFLWLLFPLFLYWLTRMLVVTHRGKMNEDPILFAMKDRVTYYVGGVAFIIMWMAVHPPFGPFVR